jgi:transcription initiation factor TFIID TATA-box-binding protein
MTAKLNYKVYNLVAVCDLKQKIDIIEIGTNVEGTVYDKTRFPGGLCKIKKPKASLLFFNSGKVVCSGTKNTNQIQEAVKQFKTMLGKRITTTQKTEINVVNYIIGAKLPYKIDLDDLTLGEEGIEYDPDQFPGLCLRITNPKASSLIFSKGHVTVLGTKSRETAKEALEIIAGICKKYRVG